MTSDCAVYDDGVLRITNTADPPGLAIAGEIDESTYAGLIAALGKLTHGAAEVHVSLGGVSYCDLAGLRAIVCVTGAGGGPAATATATATATPGGWCCTRCRHSSPPCCGSSAGTPPRALPWTSRGDRAAPQGAAGLESVAR